MSAVVDVRDLAIDLRQGRGSRRLVEGLRFRLEPGRTLGIVGESGSGKSLTALSLLGLLPEDRFRVSGSLQVEGGECVDLDERGWLRHRGGRLGMVFQEPLTALNPRMRIGRQISEVIELHLGLNSADAWEEAVRWLDRVGIARAGERAFEYPSAFSGGMRQRICIAMALAGRPKVLVADEPTTALDTTVQGQVLDLIRDLQLEMGLSVLLITHDLPLAAQRCDDLLVLYAGRILEAGPAAGLVAAPRHPYTRALLACARFPAEAGARLAAIPGQVPLVTPETTPPCVFADRCDRVGEECRTLPLAWFDGEGGRGHACFHPHGEDPA